MQRTPSPTARTQAQAEPATGRLRFSESPVGRKRQGESSASYEDRREQDRDVIDSWAQAEGVDLDIEAQKAKLKLSRVNGTQR
jgi:hypothetical protein